MPNRSPFNELPLLSAELHYFRVPRDDWELLLARMRQLGANTIATCVPWSWHEPRPGALDLAGETHPQRDLAGFVGLCGRLGLRVILKPGPFVDAGLLGDGIPPWLLHERPEIHARLAGGQVRRDPNSDLPRACPLHPRYQDEARRWIAAFSTATVALQYPSGPVVAVQVDSAAPGALPAAAGLDARLKLDYNDYVTQTLWPGWLRERYSEDSTSRGTDGAILPPPSTIQDLHDVDGLRRYADLVAFTDWFYGRAVATVADWLRADGWTVPLYHDLAAAPWQAAGSLADLPGLAQATGWLGQNVSGSAGRSPFVGMGEGLSFEEYVHYAYWRTGLARHLSPAHPALIAKISAAHDFSFAAPFLGGAEAANIYVGVQAQPGNQAIGSPLHWAIDAPVRPDGSVQARFWNAKLSFMLLGAARDDFAGARIPADIALGYSHMPEQVGNWRNPGAKPSAALAEIMAGCDHALQSQILAQRLVSAGITFDLLDLDAATSEELARYALVAIPATAVLARATQAKLAQCSNLVLVGSVRTRYDEHLAPCDLLEAAEQAEADITRSPAHPLIPSLLRLPEDISGAHLGDLAEERGQVGRYAWADGPDVDVSVRYGARYTYLFIANRRPASYSGTLAYRSPEGPVQHLHVNIGPLRAGMVLIQADDVMGVAMGGDGAEGGWLARGMHSSVVFSSGAGSVAPCGSGLLLSAPQSGRFQMRRAQGWEGLSVYRLLLDGTLLPAPFQAEAAHIAVPYVAEDTWGRTDLYVIMSKEDAPPPYLSDHLGTLLMARAGALCQAAVLAASTELPATEEWINARAQTIEICTKVAGGMEALHARAYTLDQYAAAEHERIMALQPAVDALALVLAHTHIEHQTGTLETGTHELIERGIMRILGIVSRSSL